MFRNTIFTSCLAILWGWLSERKLILSICWWLKWNKGVRIRWIHILKWFESWALSKHVKPTSAFFNEEILLLKSIGCNHGKYLFWYFIRNNYFVSVLFWRSFNDPGHLVNREEYGFRFSCQFIYILEYFTHLVWSTYLD